MDEKSEHSPERSSSPALPQRAKTRDEHPQRDPTIVGRHSLQITHGHRPLSPVPEPAGKGHRLVGSDSKSDVVLDEKKGRSLPDNLNETNQAPPSPASPHRKTRPSHDFDQRYDGPFSRPSITMTRRSSHSSARSPRLSTAVTGKAAREHDEQPTNDQTSDDVLSRPAFQPTPPPLNYTLRTRKMAIFLFWSLILFDSVAVPVALYFGLWYGVGPGTNTPTEERQKLTPNAVFSIVTAAVGGASIVEYFLRFWRLWRKGSTCRVVGAHRWYLDWFHWNFSLAWVVIMIELVV